MPCIKRFEYKNRIEVFGANQSGFHGSGHANFCKRYYGAEQNIGEGLSGQSYALPTKGYNIETLPLNQIQEHIHVFNVFTQQNPDKDFFVGRIGCGLAGYEDKQIIQLFKEFKWGKHVNFPGIWQPAFDKESARHRIIVAGGREFDDMKLLISVLDEQIQKLMDIGKKPIIVSGTAKGADKMGEDYAKLRGLDWVEFPAPWEEFKQKFNNHRAAGFVRNSMMAQYSTALSAFWDGKSRGTSSMIDLADDFKLKTIVTRYDELQKEMTLNNQHTQEGSSTSP